MKNLFERILIILIILIVLIGGFNVFVDPYFHYHKPISFLQYPIEYQRYQNNGILRNFDYDAIITGSSMTENFKSSELDELFSVNSVKVPNSGGSFREINEELERAFDNNKNIKIIVRGLDYSRLADSKDKIRYEEDWYPTYLYDNNIFNDVKYILNKSTLCSSLAVILYTLQGNDTTSFDIYSNWTSEYPLGKKHINYSHSNNITNEEQILDTQTIEREEDNLKQNVIDIAIKHPETEFYLFFTPYSICYFDQLNTNGELKKQLEKEKIAIEMLLEYDNIKLFSFFDCYDIISDLDNYRDITHYGEHINSYILSCMKNNIYLLTKDNYENYCNDEYNFYKNFDYDSYFAK